MARNSERIEIVEGGNPRELFPGYYSLSDEQRTQAFQAGLVSLDANALLDLYRFTPKAREEFLGVLRAMRPRLFLTHQAALEFHRNRPGVVDDRLDAASKENVEISKSLSRVAARISGFAKRYQIAESQRDRLIDRVNELAATIEEVLGEASAYDLSRDAVKAGNDAVVEVVNELFSKRVGPPLGDVAHKAALEEAARRKRERIPPGYMDEKGGDPHRQAGDYILWRQLLDEAKVHSRPVLFICNEEKEDWVYKHKGEIQGPRPELVLEMTQESGVFLYMLNVPGLLVNARTHLGTSVSDSTLIEAESLPELWTVQVRFTKQASDHLKRLPPVFQAALYSALDSLSMQFRAGVDPRLAQLIQDLGNAEGELRQIPYRVSLANGASADLVVAVISGDDADREIEILVKSIHVPRGSAKGKNRALGTEDDAAW
ncbi:PIN-like domain-containing protein [Micromonospora sp. NPDC005197]|uniref:PIN-like domain-containing protein n=1 Tax=Micromonospora sp. NPDC005197 TaxID=3157020 RepID=UPI0033A02F61